MMVVLPCPQVVQALLQVLLWYAEQFTKTLHRKPGEGGGTEGAARLS